MIVDCIDSWQKYPLGPAWEKAFGFLTSLDSSAPEGETKIDGDRLFARVMSYETRDETSLDAVLEAHRRYVDIQMALIGSERIAWYRHLRCRRKAYDEEKDVQFFVMNGQRIFRSAYSGDLCFFSAGAHMPQLKRMLRGEVKKLSSK